MVITLLIGVLQYFPQLNDFYRDVTKRAVLLLPVVVESKVRYHQFHQSTLLRSRSRDMNHYRCWFVQYYEIVLVLFAVVDDVTAKDC